MNKNTLSNVFLWLIEKSVAVLHWLNRGEERQRESARSYLLQNLDSLSESERGFVSSLKGRISKSRGEELFAIQARLNADFW